MNKRISGLVFLSLTAVSSVAYGQRVVERRLPNPPANFLASVNIQDVSDDGNVFVGLLQTADSAETATFIYTEAGGYNVIDYDWGNGQWLSATRVFGDASGTLYGEFEGLLNEEPHYWNGGDPLRITDLDVVDPDDDYCRVGNVFGIARGQGYGNFHCGLQGATPDTWAFVASGTQATLLDPGRGLDGFDTSIREMNANGVAVGTVEFEDSAATRPAKSSGGPFEVLPFPDIGFEVDKGEALTVNNAGDIGGRVYGPGGRRGVIWMADGGIETFDDARVPVYNVLELDGAGNAVVDLADLSVARWDRQTRELVELPAISPYDVVDMSETGLILANRSNIADTLIMEVEETSPNIALDLVSSRSSTPPDPAGVLFAFEVENTGDTRLENVRIEGVIIPDHGISVSRDELLLDVVDPEEHCSVRPPRNDGTREFDCRVDDLEPNVDDIIILARRLFVQPAGSGRFIVEGTVTATTDPGGEEVMDQAVAIEYSGPPIGCELTPVYRVDVRDDQVYYGTQRDGGIFYGGVDVTIDHYDGEHSPQFSAHVDLENQENMRLYAYNGDGCEPRSEGFFCDWKNSSDLKDRHGGKRFYETVHVALTDEYGRFDMNMQLTRTDTGATTTCTTSGAYLQDSDTEVPEDFEPDSPLPEPEGPPPVGPFGCMTTKGAVPAGRLVPFLLLLGIGVRRRDRRQR